MTIIITDKASETFRFCGFSLSWDSLIDGRLILWLFTESLEFAYRLIIMGSYYFLLLSNKRKPVLNGEESSMSKCHQTTTVNHSTILFLITFQPQHFLLFVNRYSNEVSNDILNLFMGFIWIKMICILRLKHGCIQRNKT